MQAEYKGKNAPVVAVGFKTLRLNMAWNTADIFNKGHIQNMFIIS